MLENFLKTFCNSIITQMKSLRKGVMVILLILSSIAIAVNKCVFHYSIASKGSLLLQVLYGLWIFSAMAIPVKMYNDFCDKKDIDKEKQKKKQEAKEQLNEYFETFDYCDDEEQEVLSKFYYEQKTSISVNNVAIVRAMRNKGIDFLSYEGNFDRAGKALTSSMGLKIITKYFDKNKQTFFEFLNTLDEKELNLLKDFVVYSDKSVSLYKREIKPAKSIIRKFKENNFYDIYISSDNFFTISTLYLAYLTQYFPE